MKLKIPTIELRDYQIPFWQAMEQGARRAAIVWPRRAGKDTISLQWMCRAALERVGNYVHMMPYANSVRKHIWRGINKEGERIIDVAFPLALRKATLSQEMLIELKNGSTIQFGGSDDANTLVGGNPVGFILSELAISNPMAVDLIRPILAENGGWIVAPYTPRGRTAPGYTFFQHCERDEHSFAQLLTCDDTGHMPAEALALERQELSKELFEQEYYCSWNYGAEGAIYAKYLTQAESDGRVRSVPYDPALPVYGALDLGYADGTALWLAQFPPGGAGHILHYHEKRNEQPDYWNQYLHGLDYPIQQLFFPHDGDHQKFGQPSTVIDQFTAFGWDCKMLPREQSLQPGIERGRVGVRKAVFDERHTETGRGMLAAYKYEFDDKKQAWKDKPLHDFSSHGADAWRYLYQAVDLGYTAGESSTWNQPIDYSQQDRGLHYG